MKNFFKKTYNIEKITQETVDERKVKEYIDKYIKELQRHFDMPDNKMRSIIYKIYRELCPINFMKNWLDMLKSIYENKIRIKNGD